MIFYSKTTGGFYSDEIHGDAIPVDAVEITEEQHQTLLAGNSAGRLIVPDLAGFPVLADAPMTQDRLIDMLAAQYENRMRVIAEKYPPSERASWSIQILEARALLADAMAETPWIDAVAAARGIARSDLASRIVAKDNAYRAISGALTGVRQHIEDMITAAGTDPVALAAIDVTSGWPG